MSLNEKRCGEYFTPDNKREFVDLFFCWLLSVKQYWKLTSPFPALHAVHPITWSSHRVLIRSLRHLQLLWLAIGYLYLIDSLKKTSNRSLIVSLIVKCLLLICRMWSVESQIVRPMKIILHKSTKAKTNLYFFTIFIL